MAQIYTRVPDGDDVWGRERVAFKDVTSAASPGYPSGGFTLNAADFGLKYFRGIDVVGGNVSQGTYGIIVDLGTSFVGALPLTAKLRLFSALGTEVTASTDVSALKIRLQAIGG